MCNYTVITRNYITLQLQNDTMQPIPIASPRDLTTSQARSEELVGVLDQIDCAMTGGRPRRPNHIPILSRAPLSLFPSACHTHAPRRPFTQVSTSRAI